MAGPSDNSYGSLAGVGVLVPKWSGTAGDFADTTRPSDASVINWIDQISGLVNSILSQVGFEVPVDQNDVVLQLRFFVEQEVAAIVEGINGFGRFGPQAKSGGKKGRFALLVEDVESFIMANATGFERLGASREYDEAESIGYRGTDASGDETFPIFQREAFGNAFDNWDA